MLSTSCNIRDKAVFIVLTIAFIKLNILQCLNNITLALDSKKTFVKHVTLEKYLYSSDGKSTYPRDNKGIPAQAEK